MTHAEYALPGGKTFADDFHIFTLDWRPEGIKTYVDGNLLLDVPFNNMFKKGELPESIKPVIVSKNTTLVDVLLHEKIITSKGEFRRLIEGNAVSEIETDIVISNFDYKIERDSAFRIGKKRFIKINIEK